MTARGAISELFPGNNSGYEKLNNVWKLTKCECDQACIYISMSKHILFTCTVYIRCQISSSIFWL